MKIIAITQARISSSRLPGKVLKSLGNSTVLETHIRRALRSTLISKLIVATTDEPGVEGIENIAARAGCDLYKGSLTDVLDRFYQAAKPEMPDYVVRITSDCPLIDASLMDTVLSKCINEKADYGSNTLEVSYPDGTDAEVFTFDALENAWKNATLASEREHVTAYIYKRSDLFGGTEFKAVNLKNGKDLSGIRMTVDEENDLILVRKLVEALGPDQSWETYANYIIDHNLGNINERTVRNAGYIKSIQTDNN